MNRFLENFIVPGLKYLPEKMDSPQARAMLLSIGCQEGFKFTCRKQMAGGPARSFWQFEQGGGVKGVLMHPATASIIQGVCQELVIPATVQDCYEAITYNDVLAVCFARLLLWTLPGSLADKGEADKGWGQYTAAWRPGKPHRETWDAYFNTAWLAVYEKEG